MMRKVTLFLVSVIAIMSLLAGCAPKEYPYEAKTGQGVTTLYLSYPLDEGGYLKDKWKQLGSCTLPAGTEYTATNSIKGKKFNGVGIAVSVEFESWSTDDENCPTGYIQIK